jgi:hypothetical protein
MANSPKGVSGGGGHQKDVHDGSRLASTFDYVDDEFQWSTDNGNWQNGGGAFRLLKRIKFIRKNIL